LEFELDDDITAFLSGIDIVVPSDRHLSAFNPILVGVPDPFGLIYNIWEESDEHDDLLRLCKNT
jgi:hypothetical protein